MDAGVLSQLEPWSGGRTYFNFPGAHEEGDAALRASYDINYERLVDVKTAWDPDNVLNTGQNIRPRGPISPRRSAAASRVG